MQQNLLQLDNRIIVVAGAGGGGLGTTVTRMAARAGATVIGVSRDRANLEQVFLDIARRPGDEAPARAAE